MQNEVGPQLRNRELSMTFSLKELLKEFNLHFPETNSEQGPLENTLKIPFIENQVIPLLAKQIYTDKYAAESIMLGADLFIPGFCGTSDKFVSFIIWIVP